MIVTFDFETYFDSRCSLTSLSYTDYIFDKDFHVHGAAFECAGVYGWLSHEEIPGFLNTHKEDTFIFHNAQFDVSILFFVYGFMPRFIVCTYLMAKLIDGFTQDALDLGGLATHYGVGHKGVTTASFKGVVSLTGGLLEDVKAYAINDVKITSALFRKIREKLVATLDVDIIERELLIMDATLRLIKPVLHLDKELLAKELSLELYKQQELLKGTAAYTGLPVAELLKTIRSRSKFANLLMRFGVPPPTKISKTTKKETYAFAKNDDKFLKLLEAYDGTPMGELLSLKQTVSSTISMTRAQRFLSVAEQCGGKWPVYLNYAGAQQTLRHSGGNKMNAQNLPRKSFLRESIRPPEGYKLVIADFSSIEARVLAWLAGDEKTLRLFREGTDVYVDAASDLWDDVIGPDGEPNSTKRFVGKSMVLSLGYYAGWTALESVLRLGGLGVEFIFDELMAKTIVDDCEGVKGKLRNLYTDNLDKFDGYAFLLSQKPELLWHFATCEQIVNTYRNTHAEIRALWKQADPTRLLGRGYGSIGEHITFDNSVESVIISIPGGTKIIYHGLEMDEDTGNTKYRIQGGVKYTYSGKIAENCTQAVARNIMVHAWMLCIRAGYHPVWSVHDELVFIALEGEAEGVSRIIKGLMKTVPEWAPGLPLDAKVSIASTYAEK